MARLLKLLLACMLAAIGTTSAAAAEDISPAQEVSGLTFGTDLPKSAILGLRARRQ